MKKLIKPIIIIIFVFVVLVLFGYSLLPKLYPLKYNEAVEKYSAQFGVEPSVVYSVIKCESDFDAKAVSSVGAIGLMQLTPEAFEWAQTRLDNEVTMSSDKLSDSNINIKYGVYILKLHYEEFGSYELALAAYHAGRGSVNQWLKNLDLSLDGEKLDKIPYEDTELYVERVTRTVKIYNKLYF